MRFSEKDHLQVGDSNIINPMFTALYIFSNNLENSAISKLFDFTIL